MRHFMLARAVGPLCGDVLGGVYSSLVTRVQSPSPLRCLPHLLCDTTGAVRVKRGEIPPVHLEGLSRSPSDSFDLGPPPPPTPHH